MKKISYRKLFLMIGVMAAFNACASGASLNTMAGTGTANVDTGDVQVSTDRIFLVTFTAAIKMESVTTTSFFIVPDTLPAPALSGGAHSLKALTTDTACDPALAIRATVACSSDTSCSLTPEASLNVNTQYRLCLTDAIEFKLAEIYGVFAGKSVSFTTKTADETAVASAGDALDTSDFTFGSGDSATNITEGFTLPTTGPGDTTIAWTSGNTAVIAIDVGDATVTQPTTDTEVTLTATITKGAASDTKDLVVTVAGTSTTSFYTVGGTLSGLGSGKTVVLQNNTGDDLLLTDSGSFAFTTPVADARAYAITILTQPSGQTCTASNGNGTVSGADVTDVSVLCITNDTTAPTALISSSESTLTAQSPFTVTITFSEDISGFSLEDITASNATLSNLQTTTTNRVFTMSVTPTSNPSNITLTVAAGGVTDGADNQNTVSNVFSIRYDTSALTVAITSTVSNPTNSSPFPATFTFSETVSGFTLTDIGVTNGTADTLSSSDNRIFTANITPTAAGTVSVSITAAVANDAFSQSKSNTAASALSTIYDGTAPTTDSTSPTNTATAIDANTTIAVVFSEAMDTSTLTTNTADTTCSGSLQVSNDDFTTCVRMAAAPVASNSNKTFTVTPNANLNFSTTYKIRVTTSAKDTAGNAIAANSTTGTGFTTDSSTPAVASTTPADAATSVAITSTIAVVFSRAMDTSTLTTNTTDTTCSGSLQVSNDDFTTCVRMAAAPVASNSNKTFTVTPNANLANFATFKIRVTTSARDANGTAIAAASTTGTGFTCVGGQTLLAATAGGLSISTDGGASFTNKTTANGLGSNVVRTVFGSGATIDTGGNSGFNFSTNSGGTFTNKTTANGLGDSTVLGVFGSGSTIYAATPGGLSISTDGGASFTNKTTANGLGNNFVNGVFASGSTAYAATNGGLAISTDGGTSFTNKTTTDGLGSNTVRGVFASGSTIYAATQGGLSISTDGGTSFTNKTTAAGLGNNIVKSVYASGSAIYAGTNGGLSISTNGGTSFTNKTTAAGLGHIVVNGLSVSGSTIYAATQGGLSISTNEGTSFTNKTTTTGLGDNEQLGVFVIEQ